jgi:hypothetical protein
MSKCIYIEGKLYRVEAASVSPNGATLVLKPKDDCSFSEEYDLEAHFAERVERLCSTKCSS